MSAKAPPGSPAERSIGMLALGSWTILVTALLPGLIADPLEFTPWHWLIFASAMLGLAGGALGAIAHRRWKIVVLSAACFYLSVVIVRFFALSVWWQLDYGSVVDAVRFALWLKGRMLAHHFSEGRLLDGIGITFYEALMPAFQVIVLLGLAFTWSRAGNRAAQRAR